ncbi:MAG TPA: RtcB family protein [Elusimicrobiota bacterium]|jgi:Uncharacterized conserved protein|nr:RtcB family protein [Elusimicrobiota bacterium]HNC91747.1 RtcB family protein [Anaerolineales bacterium]HNF58656.1 RtcB family protein [Elusimicrobiota bacterium]
MPIKKVITGGRVPVKVWSENIEDKALEQLKNTASLPFVFKHVAAMPDVHLGVGATIGSVVATKGAISPAAVGVDIGCGMMAVKTNLDINRVQDKIKEIRHSIERSIPVGFDGNRKLSPTVEAWEGWGRWSHERDGLFKRSQEQLGSLGGGNHFIEICRDTEGNCWVMLHSGSRGVGNVLAARHIEKAKGLMKQMFISLPDPDLAYFVVGTKDFNEYVADLDWCQGYAFENRQEMMRRVLKDVSFALFGEDGKVERRLEVNCHHNYMAWENHFNENVMVTRKGAVRARMGDYGIIPGSMGTKSFIVRGLGNTESFNSCSHGAGRRMSRAQARKQFTTTDLENQTATVECRKDAGIIDEIPSAYKDIDDVMLNQSDLVSVEAMLKQIMCVKG